MGVNLGSLTNKKKKLDQYRPLAPDVVENLERWLEVEMTYSSNAIEGNTLTRIETAEVIEKGVSATISGKSLKDQLEAVNHAKAIALVRSLARKTKSHQLITEGDIKAIHKTILRGIENAWAGRYRKSEVFVRGATVEFPLPHQVTYHMREFVDWLQAQQKRHPVRVAADAHFRLVTIHPFVDGNGRTARLLMNLILLINGYPLAVIRNEDRTAYLDAVNAGQTQKDLKPLYRIAEQAAERSLDAYLAAAQGKPTIKPLTARGKAQSEKLLKIGELARLAGETIHTLRYWTKLGLLQVKQHSPGGYQLYDPAMVGRVRKIRQLQRQKRLKLGEIKQELRQAA